MTQHHQMYIDGQWCDAASGKTYDAVNPATGQPFATVPLGGRQDAQRAVKAANEAFELWQKVPLWERSKWCVRMADAIDAQRDEIADILCTELGKPRHYEAKYEADEVAVHYRIAAEQCKWLEGDFIPVADPTKRVISMRRPRGVITVLTPWNFPAAIPGEYLPYALAMGNTVCWSPAPTCAVIAIKLMQIIDGIGLPKGVINLVTGPGAQVGDEFVVNPGTHAIGMTGSPATARIITKRAGLKPHLFELGGNGPTVLLPDADPVKAAKSVAQGCFYEAGQVCCATERILVADNLKKTFIDAMVAETATYVPGDPQSDKTTMGPQNNPAQLSKIIAHVDEATKGGATIVTGGKPPALGEPFAHGYFYEPTIVVDYDIDSAMNREETFSPIAKVRSFSSDEQAWQFINACDLGLETAVFTEDMSKAWHWAENLRSGMTVVNHSSLWWEPHIPFGGGSRTQSGIGRIGGRHTLEFMSDRKTIAFHLDPIE